MRNMTMATQTYYMPGALSTRLLFLDLRTKGYVNNFYGFLKMRNPSTTSVIIELYKLFPNLRGLRLPLADRPALGRKVVITFPTPPPSLEFLELYGYADLGVEIDLDHVDTGQRLRHISLIDLLFRFPFRETLSLPPDYGDKDRKNWSLYIGGTTLTLNSRIFEALLKQRP